MEDERMIKIMNHCHKKRHSKDKFVRFENTILIFYEILNIITKMDNDLLSKSQ